MPVALIMDNASSHDSVLIDPIGQVKIFFLPPNCTSVHQPMDLGIIAALKAKYKYLLLDKTVSVLRKRDVLRKASRHMIDATKGIMEGHLPHVLDAAELMHQSYEHLSSTTVARCWLKANVLPLPHEADIRNEFGKSSKFISETVKQDMDKLIDDMVALSIKVGQKTKINSSQDDFLGDLDFVRNLTKDAMHDWVYLEEQDFIHDMMQTEALDDVEAVLSDEKKEAESENVEEEEDTVASNYGEPLPEMEKVMECFAILQSAAAGLEECDVGYHIRRAKQMMLSMMEPRQERHQTTIDDFFKG